MDRAKIEQLTCVPADGHALFRHQAICIRDLDERIRVQAELIAEQGRLIEQLRSILGSRDQRRAAG